MRHTQQAVGELGLECRLEKVTDIQQITAYGVMMTPALVVDGEVKVSGKVPSVQEIKNLMSG
jgi:small redox-active disulfide protein 2